VALREQLVVGFGAIMIGGVSVIWKTIGLLLGLGASTLCSAGRVTLCSGSTSLGACCGSLAGSNHSCAGYVGVRGAVGGATVDNMSLMRVSTPFCIDGSNSHNMVTSLYKTSCK
jgi:hypothetical protein